MDLHLILEKVGIALGLGLLVGLQRERVQSPLAGIRTFALITVLGAVAALLALHFDGWILGLGAISVAALLAVGNLLRMKDEKIELGLTTEIAALLMYGVGAYVVVGHTPVGIVLGGGVALLLYFKGPMHEFVARIGENELKAMMQFVLIALVILPVLPNENYGPYQSLNPRNIWFMVVLIVGISLGGYLAYKLLGEKGGTVLGGTLGGLISSTATTVSYARLGRRRANLPLVTVVLVIATAVSLMRVLTEIGIVAPLRFWVLAPPLLAVLGWTIGICLVLFLGADREKLEIPAQANPAEWKTAVLFAALYALVIMGISYAQDYLGDTGMYAVALLSGLHDLDAITLSTARLVDQDQLLPEVGWRLILTAFTANLVMKAILAGILGGLPLVRRLAPPFAAAAGAGIVMILFWP